MGGLWFSDSYCTFFWSAAFGTNVAIHRMVRRTELINGRVSLPAALPPRLSPIFLAFEPNGSSGRLHDRPLLMIPIYFAGSVVIHSTDLASFSYAIPFG